MPRPVRRVLLGSAAVSCLIASALAVTQLIEVSSSCQAVLQVQPRSDTALLVVTLQLDLLLTV